MGNRSSTTSIPGAVAKLQFIHEWTKNSVHGYPEAKV